VAALQAGVQARVVVRRPQLLQEGGVEAMRRRAVRDSGHLNIHPRTSPNPSLLNPAISKQQSSMVMDLVDATCIHPRTTLLWPSIRLNAHATGIHVS